MICCKRFLTALAVGLACWLGAEAAEPEKTDEEIDFEVDAVLTESELCSQGALAPEVAVKALFTDDAARKWYAITKDNFSEEQLRDFFCGVFILRGPVSKDGSIAGLYNPWWDTILITESYQSVVATGGETGKIRKVGDFVFMSGAAFREDKDADAAVAEKLASPDGSPSKLVLELTARTQKKFDAMYGKIKTPLLLDHPAANTASSKKQVISCAAVRLKMTQTLLNNKVRYEDAWSVAKVLRTGDRDMFDLIFPSEFGTMMSRTFCRLPKVIREDFEPYGYYPDKKGGKARVYVFINTAFPRLFAVASLGLGSDNNTFEWYDFYRSDELVQAFEKAEREEKK